MKKPPRENPSCAYEFAHPWKKIMGAPMPRTPNLPTRGKNPAGAHANNSLGAKTFYAI